MNLKRRYKDILSIICIYKKWSIASHYNMITASEMEKYNGEYEIIQFEFEPKKVIDIHINTKTRLKCESPTSYTYNIVTIIVGLAQPV
jgi:hypothetical protein